MSHETCRLHPVNRRPPRKRPRVKPNLRTLITRLSQMRRDLKRARSGPRPLVVHGDTHHRKYRNRKGRNS